MTTENEPPVGDEPAQEPPAPAPTTPPSPVPPMPAPMDPRARRRTLLVLATIAVVAAGTWITVSTLTDPERQARAAATDYLRALEDGDADTAVAALSSTFTPGCPEILTSDVYREVPDRPTGAVVSDVTVYSSVDDDRPRAVVDVVYQRGEGGDSRSAGIELVRTSEGWKVDIESELAAGAPPVGAIVGAGEFTVDDTCSVPASEKVEVRLLPGSYTLGYADPFHLEQAPTFRVTLPGASEQTITPVVRPEVGDAAREQVLAWVTACVEGGWGGPTCEGEEVDVPGYLAPTAGGLVEDLGVGFVRDPAGGWRFDASAAQDVDGTTVCGPDATSWCVPDEPITGTVYFRYTGSVVVDDDGAVTLTKEAR
ncbi:hypothetical protein C8046_11830 [Serinibacter arcticus]|uniref:Uncharacterized protein n=1 Tax=Serinibacter arcticus TaxID=1655435 RepID=A0A2U1ZW95_9MICO|nr:hypothetical protein [Serinibacter arcticus]PWD51241.1 hypothetical protein C8046_11830 [Serinibacter arcticus]